MSAGRRGLLHGGVVLYAMLLNACAGDMGVELENFRAAQEAPRLSRPPGSVYTGWRVFHDKCSTCHGIDAVGAASAPELLPLLKLMGPRRFVGVVLNRYGHILSPTLDSNDGVSVDTQIEKLMRREEPALQMPAWQGNPSVNAHIVDLYVYLTARAEGAQGVGRPQL
jgi:mono/diheme cytochrome c family protein